MTMCPLYEYECTKCKVSRDVLRKSDTTTAVLCETCKEEMCRVIGASSFQVRGTGACDYRFKSK